MKLFSVAYLALCFFGAGCSSLPVQDSILFTKEEAQAWLEQVCSPIQHEVMGEIVLKGQLPEFKGQHPASIKHYANGSFVMEATHLLGGTLLLLKGDGRSFSVIVPNNPRANRVGLTQYLGIEYPILTQLLMGGLPCPDLKGPITLKNAPGLIEIEAHSKTWSYFRSSAKEGSKPIRVKVSSLKGTMFVEDWDGEKHLAKKVKVETEQGTLRWYWRSREP